MGFVNRLSDYNEGGLLSSLLVHPRALYFVLQYLEGYKISWRTNERLSVVRKNLTSIVSTGIKHSKIRIGQEKITRVSVARVRTRTS